ncbi:hypothetical protein R1sor_024459, partial [Riccia sorocarpa]
TALIKTKLWVWRVLQRGLCTLSRAKEWGVTEGICTFCKSEVETLEHNLWDCPRL